MKIKKEFYLVLILFVFILGYFIGFYNHNEAEKGQDFAKQNPVTVSKNTQKKETKDKREEKQGKENNKENEKISGKFYLVKHIIDGDTFSVVINGKEEHIRILGMNTPEVSGGFRTRECFGEEASKRAKEILTGKKVSLEYDPSQSKRDKYGRILAYVILENGEDFEEKMIKEGYAYEYTYHGRKYKNQKKYKEAQKFAEENELGLWNPDTCNGKK